MNCAHLANYCHHCIEPAGCLKGGKYIDKLGYCQEGFCYVSYWRQIYARM
jgi:hypothetical protein